MVLPIPRPALPRAWLVKASARERRIVVVLSDDDEECHVGTRAGGCGQISEWAIRT